MIPGHPLADVLKLDAQGLQQYFEDFARYDGAAPVASRYAVRVGVTVLRESDTALLAARLRGFVGQQRILLERQRATLGRKARQRRRG